MNQTMKLMQTLNNKEKQAVKAHRILTHAFYTSFVYCPEAATICLNLRHKRLLELPNSYEALNAAADIEQLNWIRWCDEAKKAGLR